MSNLRALRLASTHSQSTSSSLHSKDKKYLVRQHLSPLIKMGALGYAYPEIGNSPHQAYITPPAC